MADMSDQHAGSFHSRGSYGIKGTLRYGRTADAKESFRHDRICDIDVLSQEQLLKHYLCDGTQSACVVHQSCECLPACKYGQRYLQTIRLSASNHLCESEQKTERNNHF